MKFWMVFAASAAFGVYSITAFAQQTSPAEQNLANDMAAVRSTVSHLLGDPGSNNGSIIGYVQDRMMHDATSNKYWWDCIHDSACASGWAATPVVSGMQSVPQGAESAPAAPHKP